MANRVWPTHSQEFQISEAERVAIIGCGMYTSIGETAQSSWDALLRGEVGLRRVPESMARYVRSAVAHFAPLEASEDRLFAMASRAAAEAIESAGSPPIETVLIGSSSASFAELEKSILDRSGPIKAPPKSLGRMIARLVGVDPRDAIHYNQACAASAYAIAAGADMIRLGRAKVVLAGGADEISAAVMAGFESCRIHAKRCRPFDQNRKGLVLGEAAAFVVLAGRGWIERARIQSLSFVDGIGLTCDAWDALSPHPRGDGIAMAIRSATFPRADMVELVCAHGTGTRVNDIVEARAIVKAFQWSAALPPVVSYKGSLGHPQGASGACAVVIAIHALRNGTIFPNVGLLVRDPLVPVEVPTIARKAALRGVLCLSTGSWGVNAALLITAYPSYRPATLSS